MPFKNPLTQADDLLKEARRNTLNKRINRKGNYELAVTGGSRALDNQGFKDANEYAVAINDPTSGWIGDPDLAGLNNRYENKKGQNIQFAPKTKSERRLYDIRKSPLNSADDILQKIKEYEGVK